MQTILLYIAILNIVLTVSTLFFLWRTSRFPETPSRPYLLLTLAFLLRAVSEIYGIGYIEEILTLEVPNLHVAIGMCVPLLITLFFAFAYLEKYVLLKKKYNPEIT